jgi:hypothetical protein
MYKDFMDRNPMAGGGMLVQPSADGSRPGYATSKVKKGKFIYPFSNQHGTFYSDKPVNMARRDFKKSPQKIKAPTKKQLEITEKVYSKKYGKTGIDLWESLKQFERSNIRQENVTGEPTVKLKKNQIGKDDFIKLVKANKDKTYNEFVEILKDYKTKDNKPFTKNIVADRLRDYGLSGTFKKEPPKGKNPTKKAETEKKRQEFLKDTDPTGAKGTKQINYHHIRQIAGGVPLTTDDVMLINQRINSQLGGETNKALNRISVAIQKNNRLALEAMNAKEESLALEYMKRSDELNAQAEKIVNSAIDKLPKKYKGYVGFNQFTLPRDEYGLPISNEPLIVKKVGGMPVSKDAIDLTNLNLKQEAEFKKIVRAQAEAGKTGSIKNLKEILSSFADSPQCEIFIRKRKADGGRIPYQTGTVSLSDCAKEGAKNFQEGKFKTADQAQDAAKLLGGGQKILRGLMKYGIVPEAAYVAGEAVFRNILGEKPLNALKKSVDTFTFGLTNFTSGIEAKKFGKDADRKLAVDKFRASQNKVNSIEQEIANLETLNTGSQFGYEGDQTEAIQMKKVELEAAKKELEQNYVNPDIVQYIDRKAENIADAQMAKSGFAKASLKDQMIGIPGVVDYMDTETARVFPRQPSQTELNLNLLPNFREALKTKEAKMDRVILNAPDDVLKDISPEALELKKGLQEAYKMENLKDTFGAEQIYGTQGVFSQPLAGGGIAKLAGVDSGPPPESGPNPQGLQGLLNRVKKV